MVCWTANAAAGVSRISHCPAPGRAVAEDVGQDEQYDAGGDGTGTAAQDGTQRQHGDGGHGQHGGGADDDAHLGERADREQVVAVAVRMCRETGMAITVAANPVTKVTAPITMALAARTRPRRGLAARVTRIRPRRYSAVMNKVATTISAIRPASTPPRMLSRVSPPKMAPATAGAMSPDPLTVNVPPER